MPTQREILKSFLLSDILNFTRYFFKVRNKRKFVVGDHHILISRALNRVLSGEVKRLMINVAPRYGKAIDVDTPMLTTKGWKNAGNIIPGDELFGRDGNSTKVVNVYPQGKTNAFRVMFSDGTSLVTCESHLWAVYNRNQRGRKFVYKNCGSYRVKSTKELINNL